MLKQTSLNAVHRELSAKMVDFGGWDMPLHYGSQLEEHHAVRRDAGMFDVSHMLSVDVFGAATRDFLRRLVANNVDKLATQGRALYSCMLNERGGVVDDLIVYYLGSERFRLVVNAATADKDLAWMRDKAPPGVEIRPRHDLAMVAVQGPNARPKVWAAMPGLQAATEALIPFAAVELGTMLVARTGYTGEDGFELMLPASSVEFFWRQLLLQGVRPCGLGARDTLRLEAGMNLYGQDMDEDVSPMEAGLAWTVDMKSPRDFVGRPALEGKSFPRRMVGLVLLDKGVLRPHQKIFAASGEGATVSGSFAPTLQKSIAFARVPADVQKGDVVDVEIRDRRLAAKVVKYPFVRNGRSQIEDQL